MLTVPGRVAARVPALAGAPPEREGDMVLNVHIYGHMTVRGTVMIT